MSLSAISPGWGCLVAGKSGLPLIVHYSELYNYFIIYHNVIIIEIKCTKASLVAQLVKNPPAIWKTWVQSLGWEDPLEKRKAMHSSILAWRIPWTV